jgi:hypothetical protein
LFSKYLYSSLAGLLLSVTLPGQNGITGNPDWQIKPVINQGFIMIHRVSIGHLVKGYPTNYELNISKPTLGNKLWHLENNKPDIGITLQCLDYKNPSQLGYALTIAPYIEIPLKEKEKASRLVMRLCWGATYLTKCFDIRTNHKNVAIGSHVNSFVQFRWFWHLKLNSKLRFEPGVTFTHASNGKYRQPNLGLNVLSVGAGLNFSLPAKTKPEVSKIDSSTKVKSKNEILIYAAPGLNQRYVATEELSTLVVTAAYQRNVRNTHKFSAGIDFFYDKNYMMDYEAEFEKEPKGIDRARIAAKVGYSYNAGRVSFPIEVGYYIFQRSKPDGFIVSRLGVRYYSKSGIVATFGLRTHFAVAYTFEYGLGYRFFIK